MELKTTVIFVFFHELCCFFTLSIVHCRNIHKNYNLAFWYISRLLKEKMWRQTFSSPARGTHSFSVRSRVLHTTASTYSLLPPADRTTSTEHPVRTRCRTAPQELQLQVKPESACVRRGTAILESQRGTWLTLLIQQFVRFHSNWYRKLSLVGTKRHSSGQPGNYMWCLGHP